jgi:hypothetical protein
MKKLCKEVNKAIYINLGCELIIILSQIFIYTKKITKKIII